tara:strand:- start:237662 stop:238495 length:834 start_codon:yes stop_codon:yes gene_type:complete
MIVISCLLFGLAAFLGSHAALTRSDQLFGKLVPQTLMSQARTELDPKRLQSWQTTWMIMLVLFAIAGWGLRIIPIAAVGALIWLFVPRWLLAWQIHRRRTKLRDQLVGAMQSLANSARAGQSIAQALDALCDETAEPLAGELKQMMAEYHHGVPLPEAILDAKSRLNLDSFSMFASTIVISLQRGGRVTESLEKISRSLRENQRVERKLEAETAGGWRVVLILTLFPILFLAFFYFLHPEGTRLMFQSLIGQLLVVIILALTVASVWWSRKILNIEL